MEQIEETPVIKTMDSQAADLLRELYALLNDKELNVDVEKQNRYLELEREAEKRNLL